MYLAPERAARKTLSMNGNCKKFALVLLFYAFAGQ
jgi:hypothetical protein